MKIKINFLIIIFLILSSCKTEDDAVIFAKNWTAKMTTKIIKSNVQKENNQKLFKVLAGGTINKILDLEDNQNNNKNYTNNVLYYKKNRKISYVIRRKNGLDRSFDGLKLNKKLHGWCVWYNDNGNISKEGTFIKGKPVGKWYYYTESGKLDSIKTFLNFELIYSNLN